MSITVFYLKNEPKNGRHDPVWMAITMPTLGDEETAKRDAAALEAFDNGHYEAVANFEVHNGVKYGNRSSSVGDIFRNDQTGDLHIVASFGFDTLKRAEPA